MHSLCDQSAIFITVNEKLCGRSKISDNLFVGEQVFPTCLKEAGGGWRHEGIYE